MKSFLEEYGFAILAAIVVILLIAMCTPVGNLIRNQVMSVVESFAGRTESKLSAIDKGDVGVIAKLVGENKDQLEVEIYDAPSATDKFKVEFSVNDGAWAAKVNGEGKVIEYTVGQKATSEAGASKQKIAYKVTDIGTGAVVASGDKTVE